ncbi:MAG: hypothetical protein R3A11_00445 [Bdellovibrionota bacterium]
MVAAPHIAKAGWAELDGLVESVMQVWEVTRDDVWLLMSEELAEPFLHFSESKNSKSAKSWFGSAVLTPPAPGKDVVTLEQFEKGVHYEDNKMYMHDAEDAIYSYLLLDLTHPDLSKRKKYLSVGLKFADFWNQVVDAKRPDSGWPPHWTYEIPIFLPNGTYRLKGALTEWGKETLSQSTSLGLGADLFRIDHVPHGLWMAYLATHDEKYLQSALHILDWIENLPEFDPTNILIQRYHGDGEQFSDVHNIHSDSPMMRSSLLLTYALAYQSIYKHKDEAIRKRARKIKMRIHDSLKSFVVERVSDPSGRRHPRYSFDKELESVWMGNARSPVYISPEIWRVKELTGVPLYSEFYGGIGYLLQALEIIQQTMIDS